MAVGPDDLVALRDRFARAATVKRIPIPIKLFSKRGRLQNAQLSLQFNSIKLTQLVRKWQFFTKTRQVWIVSKLINAQKCMK
jgi:hypothetical protein